MLFDGASFADADAGHCHFLDSSFLNVAFDGGRLRKARFTDATAARGQVRRRATWPKPAGRTPRWTAAPWPGSRPSPPRCAASPSASCKLDAVNFRSGTLTDVTFEDCLLRDAEFGGATLQPGQLRRLHAGPRGFRQGDLRPTWTCAAPRSASPPGTSRCARRHHRRRPAGRAGPAARPPPRHDRDGLMRCLTISATWRSSTTGATACTPTAAPPAWRSCCPESAMAWSSSSASVGTAFGDAELPAGLRSVTGSKD